MVKTILIGLVFMMFSFVETDNIISMASALKETDVVNVKIINKTGATHQFQILRRKVLTADLKSRSKEPLSKWVELAPGKELIISISDLSLNLKGLDINEFGIRGKEKGKVYTVEPPIKNSSSKKTKKQVVVEYLLESGHKVINRSKINPYSNSTTHPGNQLDIVVYPDKVDFITQWEKLTTDWSFLM